MTSHQCLWCHKAPYQDVFVPILWQNRLLSHYAKCSLSLIAGWAGRERTRQCQRKRSDLLFARGLKAARCSCQMLSEYKGDPVPISLWHKQRFSGRATLRLTPRTLSI